MEPPFRFGHAGQTDPRAGPASSAGFQFPSMALPPLPHPAPASSGAPPRRQDSANSASSSYRPHSNGRSGDDSPELTVKGGGGGARGANSTEGDRNKKTRKRQQTSCSECHRRKQKCNQQVPCDRCIKRGTADACQILLAGASNGNLPPLEDGDESPPSDKRKRKRKGESSNDDLATRVQQLENIIRMTQLQQGGGDINNIPPLSATHSSSAKIGSLVSLDAADSPSEAGYSVKSEQSAVEEAAVAALGQLSKTLPTEGGDETRVYSGPGSVTAFLSASAFCDGTSSYEDRYRARRSDMDTFDGAGKGGGIGIYSLGTPATAGPRMTKLADALAEQKAKLLPPPVCHYLWNFYHNCPLFGARHRSFPRGCHQLAYDLLWDNPADRDNSEEAQEARAKNFPQLASPHSLAFISSVFATLAIALQLAPGANQETAALSASMYDASRSAFFASERREQPTYACIITLFSQTAWLKISGCPSLGFTYIAQAIRFGQSMGLHREPGSQWGLNSFEAEMRRRLWWQLCIADKGHSIAYGRPYNVFDRHCDVRMPANIHEKDLTADGPKNVRPLSEITEQTPLLVGIRMSKVHAEIIDQALSCKTPSYSTILELDNLLTKTEAECVPEGFRNPSLSDISDKPWIRGAYQEIQTQMCWTRSLLHRPYLQQKLPKLGEPDHYAGSRALTIMLSQRMLHLHREALNETPENLKGYFGFAFNAFEPSVNLAMAIIQQPESPAALALDQYVMEGIDMLEKLSRVNKVALEGYESLTFMREKYLAAMQAAAARNVSPGTSGSNSTNGPSPASFAYTSASSGPSPQSSNQSPALKPFAMPTMGQYQTAVTHAFAGAQNGMFYSSGSGNSNNSTGQQQPTPPSSMLQNTGQQAGNLSNHNETRKEVPGPAADSAPTPNTLFNQFFNTFNGPSPIPEPNIQTMDPATADIEKLFNFDPTLYSGDPNASWLTQPIDGGLESWPGGMQRLEGETDFGDWAKMLGL